MTEEMAGASASAAADISFGSAAAGQQCVLSPAFTFNVAVTSKTKVVDHRRCLWECSRKGIEKFSVISEKCQQLLERTGASTRKQHRARRVLKSLGRRIEPMMIVTSMLLLCALASGVQAQQPGSDDRLGELERKLDEAMRQIQELNNVMQGLRAEMNRITNKASSDETTVAGSVKAPAAAPSETGNPGAAFVERVVEPELGGSERSETLRARPEVFIQLRYSALPVRDGESEFKPNFNVSRAEIRWSGKVSERLGAGLEIQYHPAPAGIAEELLNDAFLEYYINDYTLLRVGQFVKPFGFDIQQSSAVRESPERAIFAGYFFPGQRDCGLLLSGDLRTLGPRLKGVQYFVGVFNGNRFFNDNNRQLNFLGRVRKVLHRRFAAGISAQVGKQLLPDGLSGNNNENIFGADFQYAVTDRLGLRGEFVAGNMPATLRSLEPEFTPEFLPGAHSSGGHLFAGYRFTAKDNIYARYDQFNNDTVTGRNVQAFNFGYFRQVDDMSRLSFDYQIKRRPSFNDDSVNGRLNITWGIEF